MGADGSRRIRHGLERQLAESLLRKPASDGPREIRFEPSARPDHRRIACAQLGQMANRCTDIGVADVTEDSAEQQDIRGNAPRVRARTRGVSHDELHVPKALPSGPISSGRGKLGAQFDESGAHIPAPGVLGQHAEQVAPIPRARADHPDGAGRPAMQGFADSRLNEAEPIAHGGVFGVGSVPLHPLAGHTSNLFGRPMAIRTRGKYPVGSYPWATASLGPVEPDAPVVRVLGPSRGTFGRFTCTFPRPIPRARAPSAEAVPAPGVGGGRERRLQWPLGPPPPR